MSKERELLKRFMHELTKEELCSVPDELQAEIEELLDQPEEGVYQKLLRIEDGVEVEILPSELWQDGYEAGKRSVLLSKQPEQHGTQYLLDQVARLTAENAMLKEKWSTQKRERINHDDILDRSINGSFEYRDGFMDGVMFAENHHGIGGE